MTEDKKAKLLLSGEEILDVDNLLEGIVNSINIETLPFYAREDQFFTNKEEFMNRNIRVTASIDFYGNYESLRNINMAKKIRVVLLDEFGNVIK